MRSSTPKKSSKCSAYGAITSKSAACLGSPRLDRHRHRPPPAPLRPGRRGLRCDAGRKPPKPRDRQTATQFPPTREKRHRRGMRGWRRLSCRLPQRRAVARSCVPATGLLRTMPRSTRRDGCGYWFAGGSLDPFLWSRRRTTDLSARKIPPNISPTAHRVVSQWSLCFRPQSRSDNQAGRS